MAGFGDLANGLRAFMVTLDALQSASLGPPTVAIHDHREVLRDPSPLRQRRAQTSTISASLAETKESNALEYSSVDF